MPSPFQGDQPIGNEDRMRSDRPADGGRPPPSTWEQITASFRTGQDDIVGHRQGVVDDAYVPIMGELKRMGWKDRDLVVDPGANNAYSPDKVWAGVVAARQRDPRAFPGLPRTREEFDKGWQGKETERQNRDARTVAQSDTLPWLAGSFAAGFTDPINLAALPLGGGIGGSGARAIGSYIVREFLINAGVEAVAQPFVNQERKLQGRPDLTVTERLQGIGIAGLVGGAFAGTHVGVVKAGQVAAPYLPQLPLDYRLAQQLKREVPAAMRSPQQQAAINVIERGAEIDATNPGPQTYEGLDRHSARLQETLAALDSLPVAAEPVPVAVPDAPRPSPAPSPAPAAPRGRISSNDALGFIVDDLEGGPQLVTDSGGLTKYGISANAHPGLDIANLSRDRAMEIYRRDYLAPLKMEGLSPEAQLVALDAKINHRGGFAEQLIRDAGGDPAKMIALRRAEYARLIAENPGKYGRYANGWENRLQKIEGKIGLRPGEAGSASVAAAEPMAPPERPAAMDAPPVAVSLDSRPLPIASFTPGEIGVDAQLMQFKSGGDAAGVTDRLRGVQQWDPMSAGMVTVWEALDGRRLIADGHQRLGLAQRMQAADPSLKIHLPAYVLREADGISASDARVLTALKNLREGSGSATDAAKVLRETGLDEALLRSLPQRGREAAVVRDGRGLAVLSPEAFGAVVNKVIPENYGAAIGALAPDPETHMGLVALLAELEPANRHQADSVVRQALDAGFAGERQEELFGGRDVARSLFMERAKVLDRTLGELRKLRGAFGVAARNAEALDAAGNRIDVGASEAAARANAQALAIVDRLALRKGNAVNAIITQSAERLAAGEPLARVIRDTVAALRELDLDRAIADAGPGGRSAGDGGYDGDAADEAGSARTGEDPDPADLTPAERDALEAEGQGGFSFFDETAHKSFDDPAGPGVVAAADSTWHDIEAAQASARETALQADVAAVHARASDNQDALIGFARGIEGDGVRLEDPGVKSPARIAEKVRLEGYASAAELTDTARAAFVIDHADAADRLAAQILAQFPGTVDRGWKQLETHYLDRKLVVMFDDGSRGELQLVPAAVWDAKKNAGNAIYKELRTTQRPARRAALIAQSRAVYAAALAGSDLSGIAERSASGKAAANSSGDSMVPSVADLPNSPGALRQVPADQTQARPIFPEASTATGRSSTSNNSSFTESPPLGDGAVHGDVLAESQDGAMRIDLGDGKGVRSVDEIKAELDADAAAIAAIEGCL